MVDALSQEAWQLQGIAPVREGSSLCLFLLPGWFAGGGGRRAFSFWFVGWAEELDLGLLDGQLDPSIRELAECLVGVEALFDLIGAIGTNEATHGFAAVDVGKLVVGTMPTRMVWIHTSAAGVSTDLILH